MTKSQSIANLPITTGDVIRAARKNAGMTQAELAEKLGISYVGVSQWKNDLRKPKIETLRKIAKALNIPDFCIEKEMSELEYQLRQTIKALSPRSQQMLLKVALGMQNAEKTARERQLSRRQA